MIIATLITLCGCSKEMTIDWPTRTIRVPIPCGPRTLGAFAPEEIARYAPAPVREFAMQSYYPEQRFMFGRATYREMP